MLLRPDHYHADVSSLSPSLLAEWGVRGVLVDLDNTLVSRDESEIPRASRAWIASLHDAGIKVCLVSNNWHARVADVAERLGCQAVPKALKPLPMGFRRGSRLLGLPIREVVAVGDQIFTDVLGGNAVGATTVLVSPLAGSDLPHTVLLRRIEAWIMAGRAQVTRASGETTEGPPL